MTLTRRLFPVVGLAFLVLFGGCGKRTGKLHGPIKYNDKPLVVGTVTVFDENNRPFQATVKDGTYSVDGIPEGAITVLVVSPNPAQPARGPSEGKRNPEAKKSHKPRPGEPTGEPGGEKKAETPPGWFAIPKKYADPKSTPLKFPLKPGDNEYPINLVD